MIQFLPQTMMIIITLTTFNGKETIMNISGKNDNEDNGSDNSDDKNERQE